MSVLRINTFQAREGAGADLRRVVETFLPLIEGSAGCRSVRLLESVDDPDRLVVLEEWDDVESHRVTAQAIPREALGRAMELLEGPPEGVYYR